MGQPCDRLRDRTKGCVMMMSTGKTVARHGNIDDIRFDFAQLLVTETPLLQYSGAEILDHDIGNGDQPLHDF
jgi:hypothetical protein